jgi:hypothetical protein
MGSDIWNSSDRFSRQKDDAGLIENLNYRFRVAIGNVYAGNRWQ